MTREEINKFLVDTKVYVVGKSEEIQKKLFSLGCKWCAGNTEVDCIEAPFLYIDKNHYLSHGRDMCFFTEHRYREISAEEILSLELTEPSLEERFNPKVLQPFDKVLVKSSSGNAYCWFADFIARPVADNDTRGCIMSGTDTDMVIPYNEETKHLVGTNKEAPEFYKYWEE